MNPWPFIVAAHGITIIGIGGVMLWAMLTTRRAERDRPDRG